MAYSDYGGYAYRNGERQEDRSDAVLSPDGIKSTPGMWPGWVMAEGRNGNSFHVILGDGPIFVSLYKQSHIAISRLGQSLNLIEIMTDKPEGAIASHDGIEYISHDWFIEREKPCTFRVDGHLITVFWTVEDNYYQYVRLEQPDGTVWTGWSGYGVGAGLDDGSYGYSSEDRSAMMMELFSEFPPQLASSTQNEASKCG
ncbi:hypothetical protein DYI24_00790 [Rhodopseudomonas sp. BR0C11]|nr:hypothetical protein [Rhodopseudomonas sp. BR0C11]